ncbi:hypothetical protein HOP50_02g19530 [Chloropicon primus]|nr:hypothetical protein HOP50_02g19530 [Chloropicon primus]
MAWAQEEDKGNKDHIIMNEVARDCSGEEAQIASLRSQIKDREIVVADLEGKILKLTTKTMAEADKRVKETGALQTKVGELEAKLKEANEIEAKLKDAETLQWQMKENYNMALGKVEDLQNQVRILAAKAEDDAKIVCLSPELSAWVLEYENKVKPKLIRYYGNARDGVTTAVVFVTGHAAATYEKCKPLALQAYDQGKDKFFELQGVVVQKVGPLMEQAKAVCEPYYSPALEKVDEVTKPYQPQMKAAYDKVMHFVQIAKAKTTEVYAELKHKYVVFSKGLAAKVIGLAMGVPQLAQYVGDAQAAEKMVVNTLVHIPVVTLAYLILSPFLFGGKKGKGRGKRAGRGKKQNIGQVSSPGKPAFKPQGTSPFKPSPRQRK